jgi:hypothetical protein
MKTRLLLLAGLLATPLLARTAELTITNELLTARWTDNPPRLSLRANATGREFLRNATLSGSGGAARITSASDKTFGAGQAIEITHRNGGRDVVMLFPKLSFALVRATLHNSGASVSVTPKLTTFTGGVDLGKPAAQLKTLGTGGLLAADKNPGSYVWLVVAEPESRNGVVFGWLTHERGSGVMFSKVNNDTVNVEGVIEYGKLRLAPGKTEELETLAIGYFDDARFGLEQWADALAKVHEVRLKPQPTGYCTWYSQPHGGASDEKRIA